MKKILVTGSNGLLGSAVVRKLEEQSDVQIIKHSRKECDLMDREKTIEYFSSFKQIDSVIHCAAEVGGVLKNSLYSERMFYNNLKLNNNVIDSCYKMKVPNLVNILSTCLFPESANYPLTPDQIFSGDPHSSSFGYALAKRISYLTVQSYRKALGYNWISIIPTNIYGINDNFNLENSHVLPALIMKAYTAKQTNKDFIIWGNGETHRQFIFSDDLAALILWAKDNWHEDSPFMAVNSKEYLIKDVAILIAKKFEIPDDKIKFDFTKPSGIKRMTASSNADQFQFTPLEEGLNKTIDWFKKEYNNIRK